MKKAILFIILFASIGTNTYAQYSSMLNEGSEWYHYFWFEASCNHKLSVNGDTLINGIVYKKVLNMGDLCNYPYETFVREDVNTKQVYIYYYDTIEVMIYDYSLLPGDTIKYRNYDLVLDSISNILPQYSSCGYVPELFLDNPKIFYFSYIDCNFCGNVIWVEGIGNIANPFEPEFSWTAGNLGDVLLCHYNDTGFRDFHFIFCEEPNPCEGPYVSIQELDYTRDNTFVKIYPNPSSEMVTIETDEILKNIIVYDIYGNLLQQYEIPKNNAIDISKFNNGILLIVFRTNDNAYEVKRVIKN
ncbi:MAG: T9SS type A sorting domain-containing protein [Chitinophagales bacterium]